MARKRFPKYDYRSVDLEDFGDGAGFAAFAAEILLLRVHNANLRLGSFQPDVLRDPAETSVRQTQNYVRRVVQQAQNLLPPASNEYLAKQVFADRVLYDQLRGRINAALERRQEGLITVDDFLQFDHSPSTAAIVLPALLARQQLTPEQILTEYRKYHTGERNRF